MEPEPTPWWLIIISSSFFVAFTLAAFLAGSNWKRGWLFLISGLFGFILKFGPFGFTCSFRSMLSSGNFTQFRDMLLMILFSTLMIQAFYTNNVPKHPLLFTPAEKDHFSPSLEKVGLSLALGAFMFGIGMQLGSGCATGTLVGMGEGSLKSWVVIWFFIAGATIGALNPVYKWWTSLPTAKVYTLDYGWVVLILAALIAMTIFFDIVRKKIQDTGKGRPTIQSGLKEARVLMTVGEELSTSYKSQLKVFLYNLMIDLILAVCVAAFFVSDGMNIGVMGAFPLIGGQFLKWCGCHVDDWDYYKNGHPLPKNFMDSDIFLSDIFVILGAFLASTIRRNFGHGQKKTWDEYVKAVIGGLLMGLGGRMSYGCNIGSMLSGINSTSMHGFIWMAFAIMGSGTIIGIFALYDIIKAKLSNDQAYVQLY